MNISLGIICSFVTKVFTEVSYTYLCYLTIVINETSNILYFV